LRIVATEKFLQQYRESGFQDAIIKAIEIAQSLEIEQVFPHVRAMSRDDFN
jgi:hypothetical protein